MTAWRGRPEPAVRDVPTREDLVIARRSRAILFTRGREETP